MIRRLLLGAGAAVAILFPPTVAQGAVMIDDEPVHNVDLRASNGVFNRLELGVNIGTTGLGLEIGTPITPWVRVRAGVDWVPRFNVPMNFDLNSYVDEGSGPVSSGNFATVQEMMHDFTGLTMDETVRMNSRPTITTFHFMADVYPFKGKGWRITAGFFAGGRTVGRTINAMGEMPTLLCVGIYNRLYEQVKDKDIYDFKLSDFFPMLGDDNTYLDPDVARKLQRKMLRAGRLGIHIGDFKDGTPYLMEPDKDGTVSARALVDAVRPYVGIGYDGAISRDGRWKIGFDLGAQFWGGAPKVVTHEGVDLTELINVQGKVGNYLSLIRGLPVYPTAAFKISYTFF